MALEILHSTKGELIEEKLSLLTSKVGCPLQIIADHGSDLEKGIKLYKQKHPSVIYTYDVTHAMALLLKYELANSERYQAFLTQCNQCRQQLQQTEFSFLSPPSQRSQCRYFNIEKLLNWAQKLLKSSPDIIVKLLPKIDPKIVQQQLQSKLGWLSDYQKDLEVWRQMVSGTRTLEKQLKLCGLNQESVTIFQKNLNEGEVNLTNSFRSKIINYVATESALIPQGQTLLASSDIIESLESKYKHFSSRAPLKQMGVMVLNLCLSTMNLTADLVKKAE